MDILLGHTSRLKVVVLVFSLLETLEFVRVCCVTEWLLTTSWNKTVIIELVFIGLLLVTNVLLYLGTVRKSPVELLAWLVSHLVFLVVQLVLLVYYIVVMFIIANPGSQNSWLGLPRGMSSNTPEFQQSLRYSLGVNISWLVALLITTPTTALALKIVWREKQRLEEELSAGQTKYEVKAEYRGPGGQGGGQGHHPAPIRRDSYGQARRLVQGLSLRLVLQLTPYRSYRRSYSEDTATGGPFTIPQTQHTYLGPGPFRGAPLDQGEMWSRQTSLDTSYNVPSIRSEVGEAEARAGRQLGRFDSIAEVTESKTEEERWRGTVQQTF